MARTLILHVGTYKTGTTALQYFLYRNRDLLSEIGLYRPDTGAVDSEANWGHHDLAQRLTTKATRDLWQALVAECHDKAPRKAQVVVSSELFSHIRQAKGFQVIRHLVRNWDVRVVVYLRRQDQYLESLYNHHVKAVGECRPIGEFTDLVRGRLDYLTFLNALSEVFGADNLIVRPYEPASLKGDICEDFLDVLGFDMPEGAGRHIQNVNPGLTAEGMEKMLEANRAHKDSPTRLALARTTILRRHKAPPHYRHSVLSPEERTLLAETYAEDNALIAQRYLGGRGALFTDPV